MRYSILLMILMVINVPANAQSVAEVSPRRATGGMTTEFKNHRYAADPNFIALPRREPLGREIDIVRQAQQIVDQNPLLSMILVERGEIIFEAYKSPARSDRPNFSWSMSKSLTAYTLGMMHCEGQFPDLDAPALTYSADLSGTVYGEATVRQLLTMRSGVRRAVASGDHLVVQSNCEVGADCDGWQRMRAQKLSGLEYLQLVKERDIESGREFRYSGTDTLALGNIIEKNGGLIHEFHRHIWSKIGAEGAGYWLLDRENVPIAQAGFSATTRDWARMAMYSVKLLKNGTPCQQAFMRQATTQQAVNRGKVGQAHRGYGYQTWITTDGPRESYWWLGYGGQRVAVDPEKERILVMTSQRESYMDKVRTLFADWQRN